MDIDRIQKRLADAAGYSERFALTISQRFLHGPEGTCGGKLPDIYITRWTYHPYAQECREVASGTSIEEVMNKFEVWLEERVF